METKIYTIDQEHIDRLSRGDKAQLPKEDMDKLSEAAAILSRGGLVAFPTETVYGLGGDAMDARASEKIYAAKGRPSDNPLIVHIAELSALDEIAVNVPRAAYDLARRFWPGPLTMILHKSPGVPLETTGGLSTVAVRMPSHPAALALIKASGTYVAAPSANTSGRPSPTMASHVIEDLNGKIDAIVDGGRVGIGIESTIIDLTVDPPMILRPGYITREMLLEVLDQVCVDPAILGENAGKDFRPKAPGMKYRHYAPRGELTIVEGTPEHVTDMINALTKQAQSRGLLAAVIAARETAEGYDCPNVFTIGTRTSEESIAANLYDVLRKMDDLHMDVIFSESYSSGGLGQAVMNRLLKAAGHKVIDADTGEHRNKL